LAAFQKPIPFKVYRQGTAPEPPPELGAHGSKLWQDVLTEIEIIDAPRLTILEQACAGYERAESLRRQIAVDGELIETHTGGDPLLMCELQARSLVARLLEGLRRSNESKRGPGRPPNKSRG
jgi:hypothetical protein